MFTSAKNGVNCGSAVGGNIGQGAAFTPCLAQSRLLTEKMRTHAANPSHKNSNEGIYTHLCWYRLGTVLLENARPGH